MQVSRRGFLGGLLATVAVGPLKWVAEDNKWITYTDNFKWKMGLTCADWRTITRIAEIK